MFAVLAIVFTVLGFVARARSRARARAPRRYVEPPCHVRMIRPEELN